VHTHLEVGKDASQVLVGRSAAGLEGRRWMVQGRMGHTAATMRWPPPSLQNMRQEDYCLPMTPTDASNVGKMTSADHGTAVEPAVAGYGHKSDGNVDGRASLNIQSQPKLDEPSPSAPACSIAMPGAAPDIFPTFRARVG
jgi:hypothetical protein